MNRLAPAIGLPRAVLQRLLDRLRPCEAQRRGRSWASSLKRRLVVVCTSLRTNLTMRELAAMFAISKSQVHRIVCDLVPRLAACLASTIDMDRRWSWILDGTLIPTRDHKVAGKSKNYRWSCNAQVLVRRRDLRVVAITVGGPGNRNDPVHSRGSRIETLCRRHRHVLADGGYRGVPELITPNFRGNRILRDRASRQHRKRRARVEHAIARLKDWRVLRDHRRRGRHLPHTLQAVALLHNIALDMRDSP